MSDHYIGLMSGTSLDAVDAALLCFDDDKANLLHAIAFPLPPVARQELLLQFSSPETSDLRVLGRLDRQIGECFAEAAGELLRSAGISATSIEAIGSHGQTLWHQSGKEGFTWQIGDPNIIAAKTGITTVADFRRMDMALGGQGAPLAPAFHRAVFSSSRESRVIVNIGGISNLTILPADGETTGFDAGPGNVLMDAWSERCNEEQFDRDGEWAATGQVIPGLLEIMLGHDFFRLSPPKSTGREDFNLTWVTSLITKLELAPRLQDVQATLAELTAVSICDVVRAYAPDSTHLFVCGGGSHNRYLMKRLQTLLTGRHVETTAQCGLDPDWVEAAAFAWLARETLASRPVDLTRITGAQKPAVLGGIYTGE